MGFLPGFADERTKSIFVFRFRNHDILVRRPFRGFADFDGNKSVLRSNRFDRNCRKLSLEFTSFSWVYMNSEYSRNHRRSCRGVPPNAGLVALEDGRRDGEGKAAL